MSEEAPAGGNAGTTGPLDPEAIRIRKREKQLRYQRHKARLGRDASPSASPSRSPLDLKVDTNEASPIVTALATPPRSKSLSSPYLQSRLSTPPRKQKEEVVEVKPTSFPKRHAAGSRKSGLIQQMRAKQLAVTSTSLTPTETNDYRIDSPENDASPIQETLETWLPVETNGEKEDLNDNEVPDEDDMVLAKENENVVADDAVHTTLPDDDDDPNINGAVFDMRSILDHPFIPLGPEATNNVEDNFDRMETTTDVAVFNPMDDEFVRRLRRMEESQQEEKKEREDDDPTEPDATWDVSIPLFQHQLPSARTSTSAEKRASTSDVVDMFATASWEQTDADVAFSDVENHFFRLLESAHTSNMPVSLEHQQVLEDVKRNLELAGGIDTIDMELSTNPTDCDRSLDTPLQGEALLTYGGTGDSNVLKGGNRNLDDASLLGVVSRSEEGSTSQILPLGETTEVTAPPKEDEPLLLGVSSSGADELSFEVRRSLQDRIDSYNSANAQDEESTCEEDEVEAFEDESEEIDYLGQSSDDEEDQTVDILNPLDGIRAKYLATDVPTFGAAARATQKAQQSETTAMSIPAETGSVAEHRLAALALPPPPPPPPPATKKKKNNSKTKPKSGIVPLLAPPPAEKLLKWEEDKMRGKLHLASLKANKLGSEFAEATSADYVDEKSLLAWLARDVLQNQQVKIDDQSNVQFVIRAILEDDESFNKLWQYVAETVNDATNILGDDASFDEVTLTTTFSDDDTVTTADYSVRSYRSTRSRKALEKQRPLLKPMVLTHESKKLAPYLLAANFVSFIYLTSKVSKIPSPFGKFNPFLVEIINSSFRSSNPSTMSKPTSSPQKVVFDHPQGDATTILRFAHSVCNKSTEDVKRVRQQLGHIEPLQLDATEAIQEEPDDVFADNMPVTPVSRNAQEGAFADKMTMSPPSNSTDAPNDAVVHFMPSSTPSHRIERSSPPKGRRYIVPSGHPCPFEAALWEAPRIVPAILSFLGDPVVVCRMKMVNRYCNRLVAENEHTIIQDAVRAGGINMNVRPAFWIWIALQKCSPDESSMMKRIQSLEDLQKLEQEGREGKWAHVIERDVQRSFGNMPPHKTGARLRTDSIVKALVTWGQSRVMKRGVKGGGEETPLPELGQPKKVSKPPRGPRKTVSSPPWECGPNCHVDDSDSSAAPADIVSDWGPISPVASMTEGSHIGEEFTGEHDTIPREELALCGTHLTSEMKQDLQKKLRFVLHSLAAAHGEVGYCQGMDYVASHLLRVLQDTIRWNAVQNTLPKCLVTASGLPDFSGRKDEPLTTLYQEVDSNLVVEEAIIRIMDIFFTNYNLRHMYWPELRCLKTCCRVFERLIQIKLPVLADHFEHHELNVGLFALGWFQTLFLYLPGMPSETANRMIDIWLIERSFKIFFRVGTAILFLSQPILLNHELEGMMTYLNTIPDATLLKPDILIPCALNIKVTNLMLQELESEVTASS